MRSALMEPPAAAPALEAPVRENSLLRSGNPAQLGEKPETFGDGLNLKMLALLLEKLASFKPESSEPVWPALRILALTVLAGIGIKISAGVLEVIDGIPMFGRLLQLVGLVAALQFLSRHALKQQQRAELFVRIEKVRADLLG